MNNRLAVVWAVVALLAVSEGCKKEVPGSDLLGQSKGQVAGLSWSVPKNWTVGPEKQMRAATYLIAPHSGDPEGGECAVFYFGQGVGGDVESNVSRWAGQFEQPEPPTHETREVNGLKVTIVQIAGTYLAPGGPMMMASGRKEHFRLRGAIVDGPQGSVFFKCTGPEATVTGASAEFDAMIGSLTK